MRRIFHRIPREGAFPGSLGGCICRGTARTASEHCVWLCRDVQQFLGCSGRCFCLCPCGSRSACLKTLPSLLVEMLTSQASKFLDEGKVNKIKPLIAGRGMV